MVFSHIGLPSKSYDASSIDDVAAEYHWIAQLHFNLLQGDKMQILVFLCANHASSIASQIYSIWTDGRLDNESLISGRGSEIDKALLSNYAR
jgi:hypothetical protein